METTAIAPKPTADKAQVDNPTTSDQKPIGENVNLSAAPPVADPLSVTEPKPTGESETPASVAAPAYPREIVREALTAGFNLDEIRTLCFDLKVDFDQLPGDGTLDAKARELVLYEEKRDQLTSLIHKIEETRTGLLEKTVTSNQTLAISTEPAQHAAQKIEDGLHALVEALQSPDVHKAILFFQADFIVAQKQIGRLHHLKQLQDLFQDLQMQFSLLATQYERIKSSKASSQHAWDEFVTRLRAMSGKADAKDAEQADWNALVKEITNTSAKVDELLATTPRSEGIMGDTIWADKLDEARKDLNAALTEYDQQHLDDAIEWIGHVLNHEPDRINDWIVSTVEVLLESQFALRMTNVYEKLVELKAEPDVIQRFSELVSNLPQVRVTLTALVAGHFGWQAIYQEIDQILMDGDTNLAELNQEWHAVATTIQRLVGESNAEPWVAEFTATANEIEQAFNKQSANDVKRNLTRYQSQARMRFRKVEEGLVQISGELQGVGERLNVLLGALAQPG